MMETPKPQGSSLVEELRGQDMCNDAPQPPSISQHQTRELPLKKEKDLSALTELLPVTENDQRQCIGCAVGVRLGCFDLFHHNTK